MAKPTPRNPYWYTQAAEIMARSQCSLHEACIELGVELTIEESHRVWRRKEFQDIYLRAINQVRTDLANMPGQNKAVAEGIVLQSVEQLFRAGEFKEAINGVIALAKLKGWIGSESNVNIFAGLTAKDIAEQKEKILKALEEERLQKDSAAEIPAKQASPHLPN